MSKVNDLENVVDLDNYHFTEDDFKLVQNNKKIFDTKFETKPTTYLKDALRRFKKNKSSVAGAFILGFLILCAIFVPIISTAEVSKDISTERFLAPKLFNAGTGWWDGTKKVENVVYDLDNQIPADYYAPAVSEVVVSDVQYIDTANKYAKGGYLNFVNENVASDYTKDKYIKFLQTSQEIKYNKADNYKLEVEMGNIHNVFGYQLGEYRIVLRNSSLDPNDPSQEIYNYVILKDWSKDYSNTSINISEAIKNSGLSNFTGKLTFELKAGQNIQSYILIKKCVISSDNDGLAEKLNLMSINDATESVLYAKSSTAPTPVGYLDCSGQKNIYQAELYKCSFIYDTYEFVYGDKEMEVAVSELKDYIKNGWCKYDSKIGPSSFVKLDDRCPINEVYEQKNNTIGELSGVVANITRYKYYGYDTMPKFLFGTNENGHDIMKLSFKGLRTSLIIGVCTATFCLLFGLCWGAISGYFGGNVDLIMERFCDILAGVPNLVIMTLCILHFGSNFITFFLALCLTGWMGTAGRTRTQFYRFKGREYVLASRTLGASDGRLIFRHILPNALGTIVTGSVLMIPSVIFSEASLAYLNLLTVKNSFGVILSNNQKYIETYPNLIVFPSVILALMMISFNLFGNGLRDALNPSLKGSD